MTLRTYHRGREMMSEADYERGMQEGLDLRDDLRERLADREQDLKILGDRLQGAVEALRELLNAFCSMPDRGLRQGDPRWDWWHDTADARDAARAVLDEEAQRGRCAAQEAEGLDGEGSLLLSSREEHAGPERYERESSGHVGS